MLATLIAASVLQSSAPVVTYVSTSNDRFPNFYPGTDIEKAKCGPQYFSHLDHEWEVVFVDGEYVAIDLDATELALVRKFSLHLKSASSQLNANQRFATFDITKDSALATAVTWSNQHNLNSLASNGRIGLSVEAELGDRNSSNTVTRAGSTIPNYPRNEHETIWTKVSDLNLSTDKSIIFNPPWNLTVSAFARTRDTDLIRKRQKIATDYFWKVFELDRAKARESFDGFVERLRLTDTPLAKWQSDYKGKNLNDLPPDVVSSLNKYAAMGFAGENPPNLEIPYVKNVRIRLILCVKIKQEANGQITESQLMIDRP